MEWLEGLLASNDIFTLRTLSEYGTGLVNTLQLVVLSVILGLILALPLALMRASKRFWISQPVQVFTYVFRGTPLLVQLYHHLLWLELCAERYAALVHIQGGFRSRAAGIYAEYRRLHYRDNTWCHSRDARWGA